MFHEDRLALYWLDTPNLRLATMPRPRGWDWLSEEINVLKREGVAVLVSALTSDESEELGLREEAACCQQHGIDFISFPIKDRSVPDSSIEFEAVLVEVERHLAQARGVAVHCRMGIGRASIIAAALLIRSGFSDTSAFNLLERARGLPVPDTPEQRDWVEGFAMRYRSEM